MTDYSDIDQIGRDFMLALDEHLRQGADQVSMYDVGTAVGLEKEEAGRVAENLIGSGLIEIRTLSGGIGITPEGATQVSRWNLGSSEGAVEDLVLGTAVVLNPAQHQAVDTIVSRIKDDADRWQLESDRLAELMADVSSLGAQLASPRPKCAIVRECLMAVHDALVDAPADPQLTRDIEQLLDR